MDPKRKLFNEAFNFIMSMMLCFPALVILQKIFFASLPAWQGIIYMLPCLICYPAGRLLHSKKPFLAIPLGLLLSTALSLISAKFISLFGLLPIIGYILTGIGAFLLFCTPYISGSNIMGAKRFLTGVITFVAAAFIGGSHSEAYSPYVNVLAVIFLIIGLFVFNREHLRDETKSGKDKTHFPPGMRRNNAIIIFIFILVALAIANMDSLKTGAADFAILIASLIFMFLDWMGKMQGVSENAGNSEGSSGDFLGFGDPIKESNPIVETLVHYLTIAIIILICVGILIFIYKLCKKFLPTLLDFLSRLFSNIKPENEQTFIDETEELLEDGSFRKQVIKNIRDFIKKISYKAPKFDDMPNNREKVRFVYKAMVKQAYKSNKSVLTNTATEFLSSDAAGSASAIEFANTYNRARYSDEDISDSEASFAKKILRDL